MKHMDMNTRLKFYKASIILVYVSLAFMFLFGVTSALDGEKDMWNGGDSPFTTLAALMLIPAITGGFTALVISDSLS